MFRTGKRTMVGRIRDFHGRVINPKDHFVLPNKQKLSRSDVRGILSDPSVWRGNMQSLIPQLLDYMVSPWKGAPTVAGKLHGGAFTDLFNQWIDDESSENDRTPANDPANDRNPATKQKNIKNHKNETTAPFMRGNFIPRRPNQSSPPSTLPNPFAPPPVRPPSCEPQLHRELLFPRPWLPRRVTWLQRGKMAAIIGRL